MKKPGWNGMAKCEFVPKESTFLGHTIYTNGTKPSIDKPIEKFSIPKKKIKKEIKRSLLGLLVVIGNFYEISLK